MTIDEIKRTTAIKLKLIQSNSRVIIIFTELNSKKFHSTKTTKSFKNKFNLKYILNNEKIINKTP
jgi:hypothetical protein